MSLFFLYVSNLILFIFQIQILLTQDDLNTVWSTNSIYNTTLIGAKMVS